MSARERDMTIMFLFLLQFLILNTSLVLGVSSTHRWHLQRIVQRNTLSLGELESGSKKFDIHSIQMSPVNIYVLDSGVRVTHEEFSGNRAVYGANLVNPGSLPNDCAGHGTHVAALAAGRDSGVAPKARVISVKVLDCFGKGSCSSIISALDWVAKDSALRRTRDERSVVVMSFGSRDALCAATVKATQSLWDAGVVIATAAGNSRAGACQLYPARNPKVMTVGAVDSEDRMYSKNNVGKCVDIFAPGVGLYSAWGSSSDTESEVRTGTSMAAPIVAGVAALILGADPSLSADEVRDVIISSSTKNKILKPFSNRTMTAAANLLVFAPWSHLFQEVDMNHRDKSSRSTSSVTQARLNFPIEDVNWNSSATIMAIHMKLVPRTMPAMHHAVLKITTALATAAGLRVESIVTRREYGARTYSNGSEPLAVPLVFYIPLHPSLISNYTSRLITADLSGKLVNISSESFAFPKGTLESGLVTNAVVPTAIESDEDELSDGTDADHDERREILVVTGIIVGIVASMLILVASIVALVLPKQDLGISEGGSNKSENEQADGDQAV